MREEEEDRGKGCAFSWFSIEYKYRETHYLSVVFGFKDEGKEKIYFCFSFSCKGGKTLILLLLLFL